MLRGPVHKTLFNQGAAIDIITESKRPQSWRKNNKDNNYVSACNEL